MAMDRLLSVTAETLKRIEERLMQRVRLSQINALLAWADPAFVLPTPAVGLMAVESPSSWKPPSGTVFRALEITGSGVEPVFCPVLPDFEAHPWSVRSVSLLPAEGPASPTMTGTLSKGLRLALERTPASSCRGGFLFLHLDADALLLWGLGRPRASCGGNPLRCARVRLPRSFIGRTTASSGSAYAQLAALTRGLFRIRVPQELAATLRFELDLHFEERLVLANDVSMPTAVANVAMVWNSIDCRYPDESAAGQSIAEVDGRRVHPLDPSGLGSDWAAWSVARAGAVDRGDIAMEHESSGLFASTPDGEKALFHLAYKPSEGSGTDTPHARPSLSLVLSEEARQNLDLAEARLSVEYRATTGAAANGIRRGTEFHVVDPAGIPARERVIGRLVSESWGGGDGLTPSSLDDLPFDAIHALLPVGRERTIGDVSRILAARFGDVLELVHEEDFLCVETGGRVHPLDVRVRFLRQDMGSLEKRQALDSCESFLREYLQGQLLPPLHVIESGEDDATEVY